MITEWLRTDKVDDIKRLLESCVGCDIIPVFAGTELRTLTFLEPMHGEEVAKVEYESYGGFRIYEPKAPDMVPLVRFSLRKGRLYSHSECYLEDEWSDYNKQVVLDKAKETVANELALPHEVALAIGAFNAVDYFNSNPEADKYTFEYDGWEFTARYSRVINLPKEPPATKRL